MPVFELLGEDKTVIGKATFDKKEDYAVYILTADKLKQPIMLHVEQGKRLVKKGAAELVKDAKLEVREVETVITPMPKKK